MERKENVRFFISSQNSPIADDDIVKVINYDNKIVIKKSFVNCNNLENYIKLSKNFYFDKNKKMIKQYKKNLYKTNIAIKNSMKKLKELIDMNFGRDDNELFITLTTKKDIFDLDVIKKYFHQFIRRLKHKYADSDFVYIYKFEKTKQIKKWHCHLLLKDNNKKVVFISNEELSKIWKFGFVNIQRVQNKKIRDEKCNKIANKNSIEYTVADYMSKTSQLYDIPANKPFWGTSRNIKRPTIKKEKYKEAKSKMKDDFYLAHEQTIIVQELKELKKVNSHKQEIYYRKKHKKK